MHLPANFQFLLNAILLPSLLTFLLIGGLFAMLVGLGLCVRSAAVLHAIEMLNRWISFRRVMKPLEIPRDSWRAIRRNRRWMSVLMLAGAAYTIRGLIELNVPATASVVATQFKLQAPLVEWLVLSAVCLLIIGNVMGVAASILLAFSPDSLARLDARASRWISTRNALRPASAMHCTFDHWVEHWPRATGMLITVFSLVEVVSVWRVMH
ncbi:MAG: hypothetical protein V4582_12495 [Pseudomonadota bacterium]